MRITIFFLISFAFFSFLGIMVGSLGLFKKKKEFIRIPVIFLAIILIFFLLSVLTAEYMESVSYLGTLFFLMLFLGSFLITVGIRGGIKKRPDKEEKPHISSYAGSTNPEGEM